jgi:putative nucleotidyltransferase with HDIG domain
MSWLGRFYHVIVIIAGVGLLPIGFMVHPITPSLIPALIYLGVATQVAALMPVSWQSGKQHVYTAPLVAAGFVAPGAGVVTLTWVCGYDGRVPGREIDWWRFVFNRAVAAIGYGSASLVLAGVHLGAFWAIPLASIGYGLCVFIANYALMTLAFSFTQARPALDVLLDNFRPAALQSILVLAFAGGIIYVLLQEPTGVGYLLVPGLLGFLLVVRANVAYAYRQREGRLQTLELAAQTLDARDPYTESHSQRVAEMAVQLGEILNLGANRVEELRTAGHLHDLGKIGIPDAILNKPEALTPEEWDLMRRHADIGADMLEKHSEFTTIAPMVRAHHERWDGRGYPQGLEGEEIPLGARILAVADSFDTITEARLYRRTKLTALEAVEDISSRSASWYDPAVVNALRKVHGLAALPGAEQESARPRSGFELLWRRPRFAWLIAGMTVSSLGDPLTTVGSLVAIYAASKSPLAVAAAYLIKAVATVLMTSAFSSLIDRLPRRRVIFAADLIRGALMLALPALLIVSVWSVLPILFLLAVAGAMAQPARAAAVREVVGEGEVGPANALLQMGDMVSKLIGYPLAGLLLWLTANSVSGLFAIDGLTFIFAALTILRVGPIGGGVRDLSVYGGLSRAWAVVPARAHLVVAAAAAFLLGMSLPTLIVFAYGIGPGGSQTYTILEAVLASGVIAGTIAVARFRAIGAMRTVAIGLGLMGVFSVGFAISPTLPIAGLLLFVASVGNPIYFVGNQTAIMEVAGESTGTLMAVRFGLTQGAVILGSGFAGVMNAAGGPRWTYGILALGLAVLAAGCASAAARSSGRRFEGLVQAPAELKEQSLSLGVDAEPLKA